MLKSQAATPKTLGVAAFHSKPATLIIHLPHFPEIRDRRFFSPKGQALSSGWWVSGRFHIFSVVPSINTGRVYQTPPQIPWHVREITLRTL